MFLLLYCAAPVDALSDTVLSGDTTYVKRSGYVDYTVRISQNPGVCAFLVYLDFDTSVFAAEYDESRSEYCVTAGADFRAGDIHCNQNGSRGYVVSWYNAGGVVAADGPLFTLRLKAAGNARSGKYPVSVRYSAKNTLDADLSPLSVSCEAGSITVAPDTAALSVEAVEVSPGAECSLKVLVDENPGIAAYSVYLLLDTSVFSAIPDASGDGFTVRNGDGPAGDNLLCSNYNNKGYKVQWWNSTENLRAGTLFELPLSVLESASPGTYTVQLRIAAADTTDEHGIPVTTLLTDGTITVKAENWRDVSAGYDPGSETVTVSGTPCMTCSGNITLIAASYDSSGRLLGCRSVNVAGDAAGQAQTFMLPCPDPGGTIVRLFALDGATGKPLCDAYEVELN